jgi:dihydrofolate reductase
MANNPKVSIVVSVGPNREIGKDNDLLWDIPEDRKRFKSITMGHVVIWGRKTFESVISYIHKAPPGRTNIIVTRDPEYKFENCIIVHSFEEALEKAKELEKEEIFIGGGGQIYEQAMPYVSRLYLTIVEGEYDSDTFFPDYSEFKVISEEEHESNGYKYRFINLEN